MSITQYETVASPVILHFHPSFKKMPVVSKVILADILF